MTDVEFSYLDKGTHMRVQPKPNTGDIITCVVVMLSVSSPVYETVYLERVPLKVIPPLYKHQCYVQTIRYRTSKIFFNSHTDLLSVPRYKTCRSV